jgi:hypothetical protein
VGLVSYTCINYLGNHRTIQTARRANSKLIETNRSNEPKVRNSDIYDQMPELMNKSVDLTGPKVFVKPLYIAKSALRAELISRDVKR